MHTEQCDPKCIAVVELYLVVVVVVVVAPAAVAVVVVVALVSKSERTAVSLRSGLFPLSGPLQIGVSLTEVLYTLSSHRPWQLNQ